MKHQIARLTLILLLLGGTFQLWAQKYTKNRGVLGTENTLFNIQAGAWNPMGSLKEVIGTSPFIGFKASVPISRNYPVFIDAGTNFVIPVNTHQFDYSESNNNTFPAKASFVYEIGLWLRHEEELKPEIYLNKYIGCGFNALNTDQKYWDEVESEDEHGTYYEEVEKIYGVYAFFVNMGLDVTYKKYGAFLEFSYIPYGNSSKVSSNFGDKAITAGINFRF